ncbi:hypothetical protein [Tenacibaculum sp. SZ-18]|uniref:hypothetical protein n=1 Tax=Tenacibaculum sp. SZ-18 TaxID=754423 RepID=UPI0012FD0D2A|nr:hypothetical protein [Tenacibaculum sp. SZ-18]
MEYTLILLAIFIVAISRAYYLDYKSDKEEFKFSLKKVGKKVLEYCFILLIIIGIKSAYTYFIPLNKTHGVEYNSERLKLGIPQISGNLKYIPEWSEQFELVWYDENSKNGHFKKIVEYGVLNVKSETDYYKNENKKDIYVWSEYDFTDNSFAYFMEKPNDKVASVSENGQLKIEKPRIEQIINKSEFEKFINE